MGQENHSSSNPELSELPLKPETFQILGEFPQINHCGRIHAWAESFDLLHKLILTFSSIFKLLLYLYCIVFLGLYCIVLELLKQEFFANQKGNANFSVDRILKIHIQKIKSNSKCKES